MLVLKTKYSYFYTWTKDAISILLRPANNFVHFFQNDLLHKYKYRSYFISKPVMKMYSNEFWWILTFVDIWLWYIKEMEIVSDMFVFAVDVSHSPARPMMSSPVDSWLKNLGWPGGKWQHYKKQKSVLVKISSLNKNWNFTFRKCCVIYSKVLGDKC